MDNYQEFFKMLEREKEKELKHDLYDDEENNEENYERKKEKKERKLKLNEIFEIKYCKCKGKSKCGLPKKPKTK